MRWDELAEQPCSIARTLSVIGDRWTLVILRECFLRTTRFEAFERHLGITRHILADRLKKLTDEGVLARVPYGARPVRFEYKLTDKGLDLYPLMMSLAAWGDKYMDKGKGAPLLYEHKACGHDLRPILTCSACAAPLDPRQVTVKQGPGAA